VVLHQSIWHLFRVQNTAQIEKKAMMDTIDWLMAVLLTVSLYAFEIL
jgi:hypothetical protein